MPQCYWYTVSQCYNSIVLQTDRATARGPSGPKNIFFVIIFHWNVPKCCELIQLNSCLLSIKIKAHTFSSHSTSNGQYRWEKMQVWEILILLCSTVLMLIGIGTCVLLLKYYSTIPFNHRNTVTYLTIFLISILTFGIITIVSFMSTWFYTSRSIPMKLKPTSLAFDQKSR